MQNCTFCGYNVPAGTGKMYVKKDARSLWFCSRRCEKNLLKLGRNPRTTRYTAEAAKSKKQSMAAASHAAHKKDEPTTEAKQEAKPVKKAPANRGNEDVSRSRKPKISSEKAKKE